MKAIGVIGPDYMPRLIDIDEPTPAPDEVVVDVIASSVNDFDRAAVSGGYPSSTTPLLLGVDFVGKVTAVGAANGGTARDVRREGGGARGLDRPHPRWRRPRAGCGRGAGRNHSAQRTRHAWEGRSRKHGHPRADKRCWWFALQLAKARGAVVAVVTQREEVELARKLGADAVVGEDDNVAQAMKKARFLLDGRVDTAIHVAGDPSLTAGVVRPGGRFTSVAGAAVQMTRSDIEYRPTVVVPSGHKLADLLFKVSSRRLRSRVRRAVSFDQVADALDPSAADAGDRTVLVCK
jgi:NADPH:quinone reductase-like Zn-dependent oxidoreductase